jgi:hypothetical protein
VLRDKITEIFVSIVGFCEDIASEKNTAGAVVGDNCDAEHQQGRRWK